MPGPFSIAVGDADQYQLIIAGVTLSQGPGQSGYDDGEWFTSDQVTDSFVDGVGTDGSVWRSKTNDRRCIMSVNFLGTSSNNAFLSALHFADVLGANGAGIGSFLLQDLAGTTLISCSSAWVRRPAPITLDRGVKGRKWPILGIWDTYIVGGN